MSAGPSVIVRPRNGNNLDLCSASEWQLVRTKRGVLLQNKTHNISILCTLFRFAEVSVFKARTAYGNILSTLNAPK